LICSKAGNQRSATSESRSPRHPPRHDQRTSREELAKRVDQCLLRAQQRDRRATSPTTPQPTSNHSSIRENRAA
jgi:hypothetical protein